MANRTVSVLLELKAEQYKAEAERVKLATEGIDRQVKDLDRDVKELTPDAVKASAAMSTMGTAADKAKTEVGDLGGETDKTKAKITNLADEITKTKTALADMGAEFHRTGQVNVDELNKMSRGLSELERAKNAIEKLIPGGDNNNGGGLGIGTLLADLGRVIPVAVAVGGGLAGIAKSVASGFGTGIKDIGSAALGDVVSAAKAAGGAIANGLESGVQSANKAIAANPWIAIAIAAGIGIGAPVIGAALTAAIGGGVIAGGILLAAKDPRVGSAWSALGETAKTYLTGAADVFVDPLVRGAHTFEDTLGRIMPSIRSDFILLAPVADKLFAGAAGFVEKMMPGIDALSTAAGPILTDLANELPKLGSAISQMSQDIAGGGAGGAQALRDFLTLVELSIMATGKLIGTLEKWYLLERSIASMATGDWDGAIQRMGQLMYGTEAATPVADRAGAAYRVFTSAVAAAGSAAPITAAQLATLSGQINATTLTTDVLAGQMAGKLFNSMMSLDQATLGFARSQTQLGDSINQNGRELDIHTAAGEANRTAILASVQANMAQYQANISVGMAAGDAAKAYDDNTAALERQLRKAGFTQGAIDGLIGKYRGVPTHVDTDIATKGLTDAINGLEDVIRMANGLNGRVVRMTVEEIHRTTYTSDIAPSNYFKGLASGGIRAYARGGIDYAAASGILTASSPGTILAAEPQTGGEALIPRLGISQGRAMSLASEVGKWHDFDVVPRQAPGYAAFAGARPMGGGGGAPVVNNITIPVNAGMGVDGYRLGQQIAEALRPFVSRNGNSVQMAIVGRQVP